MSERFAGFEVLLSILTDRALLPAGVAVVLHLGYDWSWTRAYCAAFIPYAAILLSFGIRREVKR
jgi:hypothetical protein